jgi:hypothetical protein
MIMTKDEFVAGFKELLDQHLQGGGNVGCVECTASSACIDCVFCRDCVRCHRTRYSNGCKDSSLLTHCDGCTESRALAYSQNCDHCGDSNYLVHCSFCFECDYCFGCVGLVQKDFHILNKKYSRSDYFRIVKQLRESLKLPAHE